MIVIQLFQVLGRIPQCLLQILNTEVGDAQEYHRCRQDESDYALLAEAENPHFVILLIFCQNLGVYGVESVIGDCDDSNSKQNVKVTTLCEAFREFALLHKH